MWLRSWITRRFCAPRSMSASFISMAPANRSVRIVLQSSIDHRFQFRRNPGIDSADRAVPKRKWRFKPRIAAGQCVVKGRAESVNIRQRRGFAAILFWRRITFRADHRSFLSDLKRFRDAKVDQDDITVAVDHDVRGLHVAENNWIRFVAVQESQHIAQLNSPCQNLIFRQKASACR